MNKFDLNNFHRKQHQERWRERHGPRKAKKPTKEPTRKRKKISVKKVAAKGANRLFGASSIFGASLTFIGEKIAERVIEDPEILFLIPEFLADLIIFLGQLSQGWQVLIYASAFVWILIVIAHKLVMK
jgi:hypothetical protein